MIAELGHFCLVLALFVALVQAVVPMVGAQRGNLAWMDLARSGSVALFGLIVLAFAALTYCYVVSDFSVMNVFENSHSDKPMLYKVSGVWGNHEGSLLLWILILSGFSLAVSLVGGNLPPALRARTLSVQAMITCGFLLFILFTSNPFARVPGLEVPLNGRGLNPLLQDPGLAFHPPMLYAGYVGFSMAFSFAIAALIEGKVDAAWARWVRPWTLVAWVFLTFGIALGSWWAYYELGWGGWWFWDPVENASFIPWLSGTALLHSAVVVEKRDALKSWTILLAIVTFSLSLLGTFLVRSGVITSVHAFATDPTRGLFILGLLLVAIGGSFTLYAVRAPALKGGGLFAPISREGGLLINNLLMSTASATVLLGTLYPLIADALDLGKVTVGAPFFNRVFLPLMVPLLVLMAIGPLLSWKRADLRGALGRLKGALIVAALVFAGTFLATGGGLAQVGAAAGMTLAAWVLVGTLVELADRIRFLRIPLADSLRRLVGLPRSTWGMVLAHGGMGLVVIGVVGNTAWKAESIQTLRPGESRELAGHTFTLQGAAPIQGPNYEALRGDILLSREGETLARLAPEKRLYTTPPMPTTEAGIHSNGLSDYYAVIGDPTDNGGFVTRFYYEPAVPFLWYGALFMGLGGLVSLSDRRHRVGAPTARRVSPAKTASPPAPAPAE
ncbi:cytochrome c-type biogenesis protein CcmF [Rhodospirillum rubrum F11]|uniref:Cytochrome c-type biogenesis protein CcmF n=3 Tax=Rhodospirillum rubrum TaxID=1085 RepID=Q2RYF5_RHORT|nr:heme lyase CcmF/NrfE family subunit [Rhodospirillum rubrum]ABC20840.1 Cytochrome c-type biogenesis protein CcmF [Rhodospirillum rubrum ATCC 11170]AEO46507.1 cytochrome c-type biogenesis protein CcmF [Rhodospirillum rubrum F11]QXG80543.1 heme lyase CcmF/NrfE family subunit [Rhodospirillum rubrum]